MSIPMHPGLWFSDFCRCLRRVEDYWQGFKLFCYAYYSESVPHEVEFRQSKLGALLSIPRLFVFAVLLFMSFMRSVQRYSGWVV